MPAPPGPQPERKPAPERQPAARPAPQPGGPGPPLPLARDPARPWRDAPAAGPGAPPLDGDTAGRLQRSHGNRYVQRLLAATEASVAREAAGASKAGATGAEPTTPAGPPGAGSTGRSLDPQVRGDMEGRLGITLSAVRIHTDGAAARAAQELGARAFTMGQDIYFASGAYDPGSPRGRALLAHELVHTLQQRDQPPPRPAQSYAVSAPDDPLERQAERIADQVARGGRAQSESWVAPGPPGQAARIHRVTVEAALPPGPTADGDFVVGLGGGLKVKKEEIQGGRARGRFEKDVGALSLPGLKLKRLVLDLDRSSGRVEKGQIKAALDIPFVRLAERGDARFDVDASGQASLHAKARLAIPALNEPAIELGLTNGNISASVTLTPEKLRVPGLPKLKIGATTVVLGVDKGKVKGSGSTELEYHGLARGRFDVAFDGAPAGKAHVELTPDYLKGVEVNAEIVEGHLQGDLSVPAAKLAPPIPGLTITDGTVKLGTKNGQLSGAGEAIKFAYRSLAEGTLDFSIRKDLVEGKGGLALKIGGLPDVKGELAIRNGALSGKATITSDKFPKGLPVRSGSITVAIDEKGQVSGRGGAVIDLFGVGSGELKFAYEKGITELNADVAIRKVPGLEEGRIQVGLKSTGDIEGEGQIAIAPKQLPGVSGQMTIIYKEKRFSGKAKLGYAKDKFSGSVELVVEQDEKGKLAMSGSGEVTARLTEWLTGLVRVDVRPDATVKIAGQLKADDIQLFPAKKVDRELFSLSQNIPLWAILVAVIRMRTGVRAGVGPGMLRGVTAEGEFGTGAGDQPAFSIRGEIFIPAYAEAYVAFGAGLGLDVLIGSLTGGIEAVGTAGIYGAVSVIPELAYKNGNWSISGVATLAAGAKLKLGLQAWAEVEAFWITVWENTWTLAEWVWDVGPELGLQATVNYVFGRPEPPTFDFKTSDIDTSRLIKDAMPKDGPKGSGARDALKNTAAWKGALKAQNNDASKVPPELAAKNAKTPSPKAPPPKPSRKSPPSGAVPDPAKAKAGLQKDLKEMTAPTKSAPADKAHDEKANRAFAALEELRIKTTKEPEDSDTVAENLADLKARFGFTTLSFTKDGADWVVEAGMSPTKRTRLRSLPAIEGHAGSYGSISGASGDNITPDHEPQFALMNHLQNLKFKGNYIFAGTTVANYTHNDGICLNLYHTRHLQTRTYGSNGTATKAASVNDINTALGALPPTAKIPAARKAVAKVVNQALKDDHDKIVDIYRNASGLSQKTKNRVKSGRSQVRSLNRSNYFDAFNE